MCRSCKGCCKNTRELFIQKIINICVLIPGQNIIKQAINDKKLDAVVVGSCSPHMHESTFRKDLCSAGLNPYMVEIANLREHCSWIHDDIKSATQKAIDLIRLCVERVKYNEPLTPIRVPVTKKALVIGGGISGIQAALDIAGARFTGYSG